MGSLGGYGRRFCLASMLVLALSLSTPTWIIETRAARSISAFMPKDLPVTMLRQSDFLSGTYRITSSGKYVLEEDISFGPRPDNDFWNDPTDLNYPMGQYYLGFFAAITVETMHVEIDLNGHKIEQSPEFYLKQRFWNAIELNDRLFVDNEGVSSLNYQSGDKQQWTTGSVPNIKVAKMVYIHDGTLGRSSHAGIHGNGADGVYIENVKVTDFEVAGIQCNGCRDVTIEDCVVGPSSRQVPAIATFSNARFFGLFTQRLIPYGFAAEGLSHLLQDTISFADRPNDAPVTLSSVCARAQRAVELFVDEFTGRLAPVDNLPQDEQELLVEARHVFGNADGLPDGSVLYGILLNHLGIPGDDENYYGSRRESWNIKILDTLVTGLEAKPLEVPALQTVDGAFVQGVARDLLRIFDLVDDEFRSILGANYRGNFLSDAYFALWKLSNAFYRAKVYDSTCGNFGSNSTLPWDIGVPTGECSDGTVMNPLLRGRDVTMLQKKYFGGMAMSQDLYDWATIPGSSLHTLFMQEPDFRERRRAQHYIACDKDTMFHPMHGVVGIKARWTRGLELTDVKVNNLMNNADNWHWVCQQSYRFPENGQDFTAQHAGEPQAAADVRGIELVNSEVVNFRDVRVADLESDEGRAIGIDIQGDINDRSDYRYNRKSVTFSSTRVNNIRAGHGSKAMPVRASENKMDLGGLIADGMVENHNNFQVPKAYLMYEMAGVLVEADPVTGEPMWTNIDTGVVDRWMSRTSFNTEAKLLAFRERALAHLRNQFGLIFHNESGTPLREAVWVSGTDTVVVPLEVAQAAQYKAVSLCTRSDGCTSPSSNSFIHDYGFVLIVGASGLTLRGAFGGTNGKNAPPGNLIFSGMYSIENVRKPTNGGLLSPRNNNLEVRYFGNCPVELRTLSTSRLTFFIDCQLESDLLGHGQGTGGYTFSRTATGEWEVWGFPSMVFENDKINPVATGALTSDYTDVELPSPDVVFNWLGDGVYNQPDGSTGKESFPTLFQHHFTRDAGIEYLKRWTSVKRQGEIRQLRHDFLTMLVDTHGIAAADPGFFWDEPLENVIDLGGGSHVVPYVVNHAGNQRMITKKSGGQMKQWGNLDGRLHEGGFRLLVGRAGLTSSSFGYLPFGTLLVKGIYVMEHDSDLMGETREIHFESNIPVISGPWSTSIIENKLSSEDFGDGYSYQVIPKPFKNRDGLNNHNIRGAFVFKNAENGWPGPCPQCTIEGNFLDIIDLTPPNFPPSCST